MELQISLSKKNEGLGQLEILIPNDVVFGPADIIPGLKTSHLPEHPNNFKPTEEFVKRKPIFCHNIKF